MNAYAIVLKYKDEKILFTYTSYYKNLFSKPLDHNGSAMREWLFRKGNLNSGSEFFKDFNNDDLRSFIEQLQTLVQDYKFNSSHTEEDKILLRAFRRTVKKIQNSGTSLL